jgi:hypothetical protein
MQASWWVAPLGLGCALLAACAEQHNGVNPENGLVLMQTGAPVLSCRDACLADWKREQPQAQQLYAAGQWRDLATLVIRVGYQDDLSLYYLGRAAEGLGFAAGAGAYYGQSTTLSGTGIACATLSRQCGGLVFPQAAALRLSVVTLQLERARRGAPGSTQGKAASAATEGVATGTAAPSETLAPVPSPMPAPLPPAPLPKPVDTQDFIEPPPAQH